MSSLSILHAKLRSRNDFLWIVLGQLCSLIAVVASVKIIALYVAPEVFGHYSLLLSAFALSTSLFFTPLVQAYRFSLQNHDHQDVVAFYTSKICLLGGLNALAAGIVSFLGYISAMSALLLAGYALVQNLHNLVVNHLNIRAQHKSYAIAQIVLNVAYLAFLLFVVAGLRWTSAENLLFTLLAASCSAFVVASARFRRLYKLRFFGGDHKKIDVHRALFRELVHYVRPLVALALFAWLSTQADRFVLAGYLSATDVGYYAAGYGFGSKIFLALIGPIQLYLQPIIFNLKSKGLSPAIAARITLKATTSYLAVGLVVCIAIFLLRDVLGGLFLSESYRPSFLVIPVIALGYLVLTSIYLAEITFYAFGDTKYILWHNVGGATVIVFANLLLIPAFGLMGAAWACVIGFCFQLLLALWFYAAVLRSWKEKHPAAHAIR